MLEAYERHPDAFTSSAEERAALPLSWWEARVTSEVQPSEMVFGAFQEGRLVGAAGLLFESRAKIRHRATLYGMYVAPGSRRGGLGRQLVLAVLDNARAREGVRVVQLAVTGGNAAAQGLYEKCGFVPFGLEPLAIAVGSEFLSKIHMWCDLVSDSSSRNT